MSLESPEPLTREQWFQALASLEALPYVRYAGPVLYTYPESRSGWRLPIDEIYVRFPKSLTEEQILAIEQDYGLQRIGPFLSDPNSFMYQGGAPLKAIDTANRLYESGLVESAYVDIFIEYDLLNEVPDDEYFRKETQQHVNNTTRNKEEKI
jgi:hypothetical protein